MSFKQLILRITPVFSHIAIRDLYFLGRLLPNCFYDMRRFLRYSGLNKSRGFKSERAARITLFCHQIEKGLSLQNPRPRFGLPIAMRLMNDVDFYINEYGLEPPATTAMAALQGYAEFNKFAGFDIPEVNAGIENILTKYKVVHDTARKWEGGTLLVRSEELSLERALGFSKFFSSRHSVRNFEAFCVDVEVVRNAVSLAQKTPSVCNRQCWHVHAFNDPARVSKLLEIQAGSRGFSANVSLVLVVTAEIGCFVDVAERYQAWIDGGMFSMSLCLALHDVGLGTCCLNWSKDRHADRIMHKAAGINESEQIIMLIAVGHLPPIFRVARSYRPPVEHCFHVH